MKPVDQTTFGDAGNCMAACIASILEIPVETVQLEETDNWYKDVNLWLQAEHNLAMVEVRGIPYWFTGFMMVGGPGPRGLEHACVGGLVDGRVAVVHDPHPSRDGLVEIQETMVFVKSD